MPPYSPLEKQLVKKIMTKLQREYGGFWFKVHGNPYQRRGLPDIIGCVQGRFIGLEVKRPGRSATDIQKVTLEWIAQAGGVTGTIHSWEETEEILNLNSVGQSPAGDDPDPDSSS